VVRAYVPRELHSREFREFREFRDRPIGQAVPGTIAVTLHELHF
jgi:hypothetical protein